MSLLFGRHALGEMTPFGRANDAMTLSGGGAVATKTGGYSGMCTAASKVVIRPSCDVEGGEEEEIPSF